MSDRDTESDKANEPAESGSSSAKSTQRVDDYGTASLGRLLFRFAIPTVIGLLAGAVQNIVNRIFVGRAVGPLALAGVHIGFPVMSVFMALAFLVGVGAMTLISIRLGQDRKEECERILGTALAILFLVPIIICALFYIWLDPVLSALGASRDVLPYAHDYFSIFLIGMVLFCPSSGLTNIIRAQGAPHISMWTQVLGSFLNLAFNYLFVMVLGWGVKGAALGLLLGNLVSLLWVLGYFLTGHGYLRLRAKCIRLDFRLLGKMCALGLSPFLFQLANSLQQVVMNRQLVTYGGDGALAALSIILSLSTLLIMPMVGINQAGQPIIGYNYGAGNWGRVKGTFLRSVVVATAFSLLSFVLIQLYAEGMVGVFTTDLSVNSLAAHGLRVYFAAIPIIGFQTVCGGFFQALGRPGRAAFVSLSRQVIFLIPCVLILPLFLGFEGCWLAAPVSDVLATLVAIGLIIHGFKTTKQEIENKQVRKLVS